MEIETEHCSFNGVIFIFRFCKQKKKKKKFYGEARMKSFLWIHQCDFHFNFIIYIYYYFFAFRSKLFRFTVVALVWRGGPASTEKGIFHFMIVRQSLSIHHPSIHPSYKSFWP